jgi:5-hydroxyisourate hydrolase-like protein (transthyretin family)
MWGATPALAQSRTISGTIRNASTNAVVQGVSVSVYRSNAGQLSFVIGAVTNASGVYTATIANTTTSPGPYFLVTNNQLGLVDQAYSAPPAAVMPCVNGTCTILSSSPVAAGASATGIDFNLVQGGTLTGSVTSGGANIVITSSQTVTVSLYNSAGVSLGAVNANASGVYTFAFGLPAGNYFAKTTNNVGLVDQLYSGTPCLGNQCFGASTITAGTAIPVTAGAQATANFDLSPGGRLAGTITNAAGQPVTSFGTGVSIYNSNGLIVSLSFLTNGAWATTSGLPSGTYYVKANDGQNGLISELYDNIACPNFLCTHTDGTPITVTAPNTTTVNMSLAQGGTITGTVRNASTTAAVQSVSVAVLNSAGVTVGSTTTNSSGVYTVRGLPAGDYFIRTSNSLGLIDEVYNNITCVNCSNTQTLAGTAVTLAVTDTITADFSLDVGGTITGTVTDDGSSTAPLSGVSVSIVNSSNQTVRSASTNASGVYSVGGLLAGSYFARTSNSLGYVDEVYDNVVCTNCNVTTAAGTTPVSVTQGATTSGINFALSSGGRVSGTVTDSAGAALAGVTVSAYSASGSFLSSGTSSTDGAYTVTGLPAGSVVLRTSNSLGYLDKLHNNIPCLSCNVTAGAPVAVTLGATTSGINFSLASGGRISGSVTNASTTAPVAFASISFYTVQGVFAANTSSTSTGTYISPGLPAGSYVAFVGSAGTLIPELYDDIVCLSCNSTAAVNGTAIAVTVGNTTTGVNFALQPGGSLTGTVRDSASNPIASMSVTVVNASNTSVASGLTNAQGVFTATGLPTGTYYVRTSASTLQNYLNQVFNAGGNLVCLSCNATVDGSAVTVTTGATTSNINFNLAAGGTITGTVSDTSAAPIVNLQVQAYNSAGSLVRSAQTTSAGAYSITGLAAGTYYLKTSTSSYVNQVFDGVSCVSCTATTGTPVVVTTGSVASGKNFTLAAGGRVGGTITTTAGAPIASVSVSLYNAAGAFAGSASTNTAGVYLVSALPPGAYFAKTSNSQGFINEVFDNITCVSCGNTGGTAITVTAGTQSTANFQLVSGGKIGGTVTVAGSGDPLPGATVSIYTSANVQVASSTTNDAGVFLTSVGLPAGTYFAHISASGYVPKVYNNISCPSCARNSGTPITVTAGATTSGIDTALILGGRVTGRVVDSASAGIQFVTVSLYDKNSAAFVASASTSASGGYAVVGLPAGSYVARTGNSLGYLNEIYDNNTCATCNVTTGAAIAVAAGATTENINFALDLGGRIAGTVRDSASTPLASVTVSVYDAQNRFVTSASTNQSGVYLTGGVLPGRYYVKTTFNSGNFINQLYDAKPCFSCAANTGTAVDVAGTATTSNINFALAAGGGITGVVRDASSAPLANVTIRILDVDNTQVASALTNAQGVYAVSGLPTNTYYAKTANALGLVDQIYNGVPCLFCSATAGVPIAVITGASVSNINFTLSAGGGIGGTVTGPDGAPVDGVTMQVYGPSGGFIQSINTNAAGQYATTVGLPPGSYYVRTSNSLGFIDEVYNNTTCVNCNPLTGAPIAVAAATATSGIDFSLASGGQVTGTITSSTGAPIDRVSVIVLTAAGVQVSSATTNANGEYRTGAVPAGTYYVRTRNTQGFTDQVYNGRECSNCNPTLGNAVTVAAGTNTTGINFSLVFGGRIAGTVRNTAGTPIPDVTVVIFTSGGVSITSGTTDSLGTYTGSAGLPSGTYYARTSNGAGFVDKIYNDVSCVGCSPTVGTPIVVTAGSVTTGIDFSLVAGGRIAGTVTDATTTLPIANGFVNVFSSTGVLMTQATLGSNGQYVTPTGLAPGTYYARSASRLGYISKVWNNINCAACSAITGTPITVTADTTTTGIDFAMVRGGKLSGSVTDVSTGAPLRNVTVQTYDAANNLVTTSTTDSAGQFVSASGLPVGTYFVRTLNSGGYIDQVYNNVTCLVCLTNIGTGVVIGAGAEVTEINFALAPGGRITGTVIETSTSLPLSGVTVKIVDANGKLVSTSSTDSAGGYQSNGGLPTGNYFVRTSNSLGYLDKVYNNTVCVACDPRLGTAVAVSGTATTSEINFSLAPGGSVSGTVTAGDTSLPLGNVKVSIYNASGSLLGSVVTDSAGTFSGTGLAAGTYFLRTFNLLGYVDEAFDNSACAPCNILASTPVTITAGGSTTGRNFVLAKGGLVSGYVIDSISNAPLVGVTVSFYQVGTTTFVGRTLPTDESGYYAISLPVGTYTAVTDAVNGYATSGTSSRIGRGFSATGTVGVTLGGETSGVTFGLAACTPPTFVSTSLANGRVGVNIPALSMFIEALGSGALTFSVASGTFTPGLTLATNGMISGTPTVAGTANFTVGVADGQGCSATQEFAQTIVPALVQATSSPQRLRFGAVRNSSGVITSVTGPQTLSLTFPSGSPAWTVTKTDLDWLELSSTSGTGAGLIVATVTANSPALVGKNQTSGALTIQGPDLALRSIVVDIWFDTTNGATPTVPVGQVDTPAQNATGLQGAIGVTGWVLDNIGVAGVKIYRNCLPFENQASCQVVLGHNVVFVGDAAFLAGARPDVESAFSGYPQNNRAGWGYLMLTSMLPHVTNTQGYGGQGALTLYAVATDLEGNQKLLGRSSDPANAEFAAPTAITMANDSIAKPFGAIDTPAQGATVSGVLNNFGWALTPDSNTTAGAGDILIPTNGSTMTVFIDGLPTALVTYNQCRGSVGNPVPAGQYCNDDVANIFGNTTPQAVQTLRTSNPTLFRNLDADRAAIGSFTINTTTLTNGLHTIAWSVTDSAGRTEGIGSRFFNVLNSGADLAIGGSGGIVGNGGNADAALRAQPALARGLASSLSAMPSGDGGVWVRTGFDLMQTWADLPMNADGLRHVIIAETERLELWLGGAVDAGYLVANGTLRDLPVGASHKGAQFAWVPPAGYVGTYHLAFIRGSERIDVAVTVGGK